LSKRQTSSQPQYNPSAPRTTKRQQVRQERRRRAITWNLILIGTAAVFLLLIAWYVLANQRPGPLPGEQTIADEGAAVYPAGQALTHAAIPPSSGQRYEAAAPWGLASTAVDPGNYLTNLYNGGVVYLYECAAPPCADLIEQFQTLLDKAPPESRFNTVKIVVSPYDGDLPAPIVALAWNHQLNVDQFDEGLLLRWYRRFVDNGPDNQP
jgi:hypothetical protein